MHNNRSEAHEILVKELIVALSQTGVCRVWPQATGAAFRGEAFIRYGILGGGDISGVIVGGQRLEVECKTGKGVLRKSQIAFGNMITKMGGLYIVARQIEPVVARVKEAAQRRGYVGSSELP